MLTASRSSLIGLIALVGIGTSAIAGELARSYWEFESPMPLVVVRNYAPPAFINSLWYIIAASYSGNTAETLAAVEVLHERRCQSVLAVTSGGELAARARSHRWRTLSLPTGMMPRVALGYSLGATLIALARWGVVGNNPGAVARGVTDDLSHAETFLKDTATSWQRDTPLTDNPAKSLAGHLAGRFVVVVGATGSTDVTGLRFKNQLCENAKALALATALPESNHHEIVGFDGIGDASLPWTVVFLCSDDDAQGTQQQRAVLKGMLSDRGVDVVCINALGKNRLERLLYLVHFGDLASYYTAILNGVDPTPIEPIDRLKNALKSSTT